MAGRLLVGFWFVSGGLLVGCWWVAAAGASVAVWAEEILINT